MRRAKNKSNEQGIYDVNMTPLIDVSLVLVVILLVATPMALQSSIAVQRAGASSGAPAPEVRSERIEIAITSPDSVEVNRQRIANAELGATLRPLLSASTTRRVVVQCGADVTHGSFVHVLDEAKYCGAAQIAVSTR